jgi:hypothetical protein
MPYFDNAALCNVVVTYGSKSGKRTCFAASGVIDTNARSAEKIASRSGYQSLVIHEADFSLPGGYLVSGNANT